MAYTSPLQAIQNADFTKPLERFTAKTGELTELGDTPYDRWVKAQGKRIGMTSLPTYKTPSTASYGEWTEPVYAQAKAMGQDYWAPPKPVTSPTVTTVLNGSPTQSATPQQPPVAIPQLPANPGVVVGPGLTPTYNAHQQAVVDEATRRNPNNPQLALWDYATKPQDGQPAMTPEQIDQFFGWQSGDTQRWAVANGLMPAPQGNYNLTTGAAPAQAPTQAAAQQAAAQQGGNFSWDKGVTQPTQQTPVQDPAGTVVGGSPVTQAAVQPDAYFAPQAAYTPPVAQAPTQAAAQAPAYFTPEAAPVFDPGRAQIIRDYWSGLQGQGDDSTNVNNIVAKAKELNIPFAEFSNAFGADVAGGNQFLSQYGLRGWAKGGLVSDDQEYCSGGRVRRNYADGDLVDLTDKYRVGSAGNELNQKYAPPGATPELSSNQGLDMSRVSPEQIQMMLQQDPSAMARGQQRFIDSPTPAEVPTVDGSVASLLGKYLDTPSAYAGDYREAQRKATEAQSRFQSLLEQQMAEPGAQGPSKAELYFNLAAAFGAPTKTGSFMEGVGEASKVLGAHQKAEREAKSASRAERMKLGLTVAQANAAAAKDEAANLRTLTTEEMKDKRAMLLEAAKEFYKSNQPQSEAGKAAVDAGLKRGTPEYNAYVNKFVQDKFEKSNELKEAMVLIAQQNANQGAERVAIAKGAAARAEEAGKKLTPSEMKLKTETEDLLNTSNRVAQTLKEAYTLNPNTFDTSWGDAIQRKILEGAGSKDEKVQNTRLLEQMLKEQGVEGLKAAFGGNPTEGERAIILELQGIGSKSVEERSKIIMRAYKAAVARAKLHEVRLNDIKAGKYRETTPEAPATQGAE